MITINTIEKSNTIFKIKELKEKFFEEKSQYKKVYILIAIKKLSKLLEEEDEQDNDVSDKDAVLLFEGHEVDLDDIIYKLSDDEALALGIDKRKMDEYVGKTR